MRMFTNLLYDICTVLSCLRKERVREISGRVLILERIKDSGINVIMSSVKLLMLKGCIVWNNGELYFPGMNIFIT